MVPLNLAFERSARQRRCRVPSSLAPRRPLNAIVRHHKPMDADLDSFTREELIAEVKKLRAGIRTHRDATGHELCWHHPALWSLLPEQSAPLPVVPDWPQFLRGCIRYRQSLDEQLPKTPRSEDEYGV